MQTNEMKKNILVGGMDERFLDIYVDATKLEYHKRRYVQAIELFEAHYGAGEAEIFSAPGRSEVGGNHTDHQHGEVLAASINLDTIGIVRQTGDNQIRIISDDYDEVVISLDNIECKEEEKETTTALIKGVVAGFMERGYKVGGFRAYATSDVLIGAGLSSSAAFETLIGTILSGLYNDMSISAIEIAIIGQYAENIYFGKPCGLMDQMACSVGNLVHIDFKDPKKPEVERLDFNMSEHGYSLCITDTKGSHADLTDEYAAVPQEMKKVANHFGKEVLREVEVADVIKAIPELREKHGDRSVLRALHFFTENERVQKEVNALKWGDMNLFMDTMKKTWMPLYEQYTDGKLSREDFLEEKKKYDEETARLEQRLHELQSKQELQQENAQQIEKNISQLGCYADQMELTEEIKEKLIDKVNVYSDNKIEICWNFDSGFFDLETMHKCG